MLISIALISLFFIGIIVGVKTKNREIKSLAIKYQSKEFEVNSIAKEKIEKITKQLDVAVNKYKALEIRLTELAYQNNQLIAKIELYKSELQIAKINEFQLAAEKSINAQQSEKIEQIQSELVQQRKINSDLYSTYSQTISKIMQESALLPSVVEWAWRVQESIDSTISRALINKSRPAYKAALEIRQAKEEARDWKKFSELLKNRISLYEAEAPWLIELVEFPVKDIIIGLQQEAELKKNFVAERDPSSIFVTSAEWNNLNSTQRHQLALDRYWEGRQKNAWLAGLQYERFIGFTYEQSGFDVQYHGATRGVADLGIDLICAKDNKVQLIQCKRLSAEKGIPVRENVVAQIFGASIFYAYQNSIKREDVTPVIITTYELSDQAKEFASALGVVFREGKSLERYPCIKCNISENSGEKIYHLPFDQQYDSTRIEKSKGEQYAMTIVDAEKLGFRRAFKWRG